MPFSAPMLSSATSMLRNCLPIMSTTDHLVSLSLTSGVKSSTSCPIWDSAESLPPSLKTSPVMSLRELYAPSLDPTLLSTLIAATPVDFPLHLQLEIAQDLILPMAMDLLCHQVTNPALLSLMSETPPSGTYLLLLPKSLQPLWKVEIPLLRVPPLPQFSSQALLSTQSLAPPPFILGSDAWPATSVESTVTPKSIAPSTSAPSAMPQPLATSRQTALYALTRTLLQEMALSDLVNQPYKEGNVMEFVGLHDIPYIFLSPEEPLYVSIVDFLTSLDWFHNLSTFIPDAPFP